MLILKTYQTGLSNKQPSIVVHCDSSEQPALRLCICGKPLDRLQNEPIAPSHGPDNPRKTPLVTHLANTILSVILSVLIKPNGGRRDARSLAEQH